MNRFIKWRHMREGLTLNGSWGHYCHMTCSVSSGPWFHTFCAFMWCIKTGNVWKYIRQHLWIISRISTFGKQNSISHHPSVFRALQEENADLHQNLLQTVVCIESLEVELQRTRDELSHVKEKYKRFGIVNRTELNMHGGLTFLLPHDLYAQIHTEDYTGQEKWLPCVVWWCCTKKPKCFYVRVN